MLVMVNDAELLMDDERLMLHHWIGESAELEVQRGFE